MSGMTPEMTSRMLNAASEAIAERMGGGEMVIADVLGGFFAELGIDTYAWLSLMRPKAEDMARDFAEEGDGSPVELLLAASIAISLGEGFMLGVEFVRAQRRVQAAMQ